MYAPEHKVAIGFCLRRHREPQRRKGCRGAGRSVQLFCKRGV